MVRRDFKTQQSSYESMLAAPSSAVISVLLLIPALSLLGCGAITSQSSSISANTAPILLQLSLPQIVAGQSELVTATQQGVAVSGGQWSVIGAPANGSIDSTGMYLAPPSVAKASIIAIEYSAPGQTASTTITVLPVATNSPGVTVQAAQSTVQVQGTDQLTAMQQGTALTGGTWVVLGGPLNGSIDASGLYQAPPQVPIPATVSIAYVLGQAVYEASVSVSAASLNIQLITPSTLTTLSTQVVVTGSGFAPGCMIAVNAVPVATTYMDDSHLSATVVLPVPTSTTLQITVLSAAPGGVATNAVSLPVSFPTITVQPAILSGGLINLSISGTNFDSGDVIFLSGTPLATHLISPTSITATGFLPPWISGSVVVQVSANDGLRPISALTVPVQPTPVTFDAAARFATQAAMGPRPDVVMAIQQQGFSNWITQQFQQPALSFDPAHSGKTRYIRAAIQGNSLLRQRLALALQSFIVPQEQDFDPSATEFEVKLENDASGNFRALLDDITVDPNLAYYLNLANNVASKNTLVQPNQNFARELMQLFTIGPFMLNDDGSVQVDQQGTPLPAYTQATVIDLTRALTGWTYPQPVNPTLTIWGVDWSLPLTAIEDWHDHNAKLLFGSVVLPAGQTALQDRAAALDAIFNHPSLPPFISRLLIQRLVTSNPSPAYIRRVSSVFEDNGAGVRGDLNAVVRAILLDLEARLGDTSPSAHDGFLREPYLFQLSTLAVLDASEYDDQIDYLGKTLGENSWNSPTVFGFFSPSYRIPGTTIGSPEFSLLTNISVAQKSNALWNMVYQQNYSVPATWLFQNFTTVPALLDAINHLLYHGTMSQQERDAISNYCATLNPFDIEAQRRAALFLALDAESNDVSH
jgi:uncharacterized protein (DUF1800 family)